MAMSRPEDEQPAELRLTLSNETATLELGARLAELLQPGFIIFLSGELGSGKTTLVRGCLRALGFKGRVKSPTFALVESYIISSLYLHHFDFYRFQDPSEWLDAGFRDTFGSAAVCLVEWPEKAGDLLPDPDLWIALEHIDGGREARIAAHTARGRSCLNRLSA